MIKKIDVYAWELIPTNERTLNNPDFEYIVRAGKGLLNYTYKIEGDNIYIGRWYRAVEEITLQQWQRLPQGKKSIKYENGKVKFYKGIYV